jgi:hypothetical protein
MLAMLAAFADSSGPDTRGGADPAGGPAPETIARDGQIAPLVQAGSPRAAL